jgi:hypothetical protein
MDNQIPFEQLDIFTVLGVAQDDPDREAFLQQMEEAIWEEIVENELSDKLGETELAQIETILNDEAASAEEKRDHLFGMLVDKVPNFEKVVRDYTMAAKRDLLSERLEGTKEYYSQTSPNADKLSQVERAAQLFEAAEFSACAQALNAIQG